MKTGIKNFFATGVGVIAVGALIGILAPLLQKLGNPGNMGVCVACFNRDIAGALGLHKAGVVQYMRPEIIGFVLGSTIAALAVREFNPRGGSSPLIRFFLGMFAVIGALIFLGCPWRALLRLSGGDLNALLGIAGLVVGIWIGTMFFKSGFSLGRSAKMSSFAGWVIPITFIGFLILRILYQPPVQEAGFAGDSLQSGLLWYSLKGPGSMFAPLAISLVVGLVIGIVCQRSRFCTMGAFRDLILFRQLHLLGGVVALVVVALIMNMILGQFKLGFASQPIAHTVHFWNFAGMILAGLAFALAGGCPGRQCFMSGEGDTDAGIFVIGMIVGAAFAHNFGLASSPTGIGAHAITAWVIGMVFCIAVGLTMKLKVKA
jgi:YedE family putative selenium metabolism protein